MLARWEQIITDAEGNVVPGALVQVRREEAGLPLAVLYFDEDGPDGIGTIGNPVTADANGKAFFHVVGFANGYRIRAYKDGFQDIRKHVRIGNAGGFDADQFGVGSDTDRQVATLADRDDFDAEEEGFSVLVSDIGDGRAGIYTRDTATEGVWIGPAIVTGPAGVGRGLSFDVVVATLAERDDYDLEEEGFTVLVTDSGDGRAAIYAKVSEADADWSDPAYIVGDRFDLSIYVADNPYSAEELAGHVFTNSVNFPAGLTGSQGFATDAATADAEFNIKKNGSSIGTVTFVAASNEATFTLSGGAVFVAGDVLTLVAPDPQDATLWQVSITLAGTRTPAP